MVERRKDAARRNQRSFGEEFKRQVVEGLLSRESWHDIGPSLLYHWEKIQGGKFNNEPIEEGALRDRAEKLERLAGKLKEKGAGGDAEAGGFER